MSDHRDASFGSVIFGTDFSDGAGAAGRYAALFAKHYGAELVVAHAFRLTQPASEVEAVQHVHSVQRQDLEHLLSETVESLAPLGGRATSILAEASPIELIRQISESRERSLVVLGTHGGGTLERHIIGSVAEGIVRNLETPVLTVGPQVEYPTSSELAIGRILYATDFSLAAAAAAPYAVGLARSFGSDIDVMHVVAEGAMEAPSERTNEQEQAFLDALHAHVPQDAVDLWKSRTFVEFGEVRDRILQHATGRRIDLIVLGAHHHSRLAMHVRTGPAFQVIMAAACPVLTISRL
jgi:nucleotide-binding universal stress UspA family protein